MWIRIISRISGWMAWTAIPRAPLPLPRPHGWCFLLGRIQCHVQSKPLVSTVWVGVCAGSRLCLHPVRLEGAPLVWVMIVQGAPEKCSLFQTLKGSKRRPLPKTHPKSPQTAVVLVFKGTQAPGQFQLQSSTLPRSLLPACG